MSERSVLIGVGAALTLLFLAMPTWRGESRARFESYAIAPAAFEANVQAMVTAYKVGEEDGIPVVRPPPGDVYVAAERWHFRPLLDLRAGGTYRIHVASGDILHGVVIGGHEALLVPGQAAVLAVTAGAAGRMTMVCSEYCGLEHNKMRQWVTVTE